MDSFQFEIEKVLFRHDEKKAVTRKFFQISQKHFKYLKHWKTKVLIPYNLESIFSQYIIE